MPPSPACSVIPTRQKDMQCSEYWQYVYIVHSILRSALFNKIYLLCCSVQLEDQIMPDDPQLSSSVWVLCSVRAFVLPLQVCHVGGTSWTLSRGFYLVTHISGAQLEAAIELSQSK